VEISSFSALIVALAQVVEAVEQVVTKVVGHKHQSSLGGLLLGLFFGRTLPPPTFTPSISTLDTKAGW
jgi:hypothetical protein